MTLKHGMKYKMKSCEFKKNTVKTSKRALSKKDTNDENSEMGDTHFYVHTANGYALYHARDEIKHTKR